MIHLKGHALLLREISNKVICEKNQIFKLIFANNFMTMNGYTYKLFKNIFNEILIEGKWEIYIV